MMKDTELDYKHHIIFHVSTADKPLPFLPLSLPLKNVMVLGGLFGFYSVNGYKNCAINLHKSKVSL